MGFYPQSPQDEIILDNFRDVVSKYRTLCLDGLIVKPANGIYPRLSISHLRGARAGEELVNFLCRCLIHHAPLSILDDIETMNDTHDFLYILLAHHLELPWMLKFQHLL